MKYLLRMNYWCKAEFGNGVKGPGIQDDQWIIFDLEKEPRPGVFNREAFKSGPLPNHDCKRYYDSDSCDMDSGCNWQEILEIRPFSEEEAIKLGASIPEGRKVLEKLCQWS